VVVSIESDIQPGLVPFTFIRPASAVSNLQKTSLVSLTTTTPPNPNDACTSTAFIDCSKIAIVPFDAIARGCLDKSPPAEQGVRPNASISEVVEGVRGRRLGNVPSAVEDRIGVLVSAGLTVLELFEQATAFKRCVGWEFWPVRSFWTDHLSGSLSKHSLSNWMSNPRFG